MNYSRTVTITAPNGLCTVTSEKTYSGLAALAMMTVATARRRRTRFVEYTAVTAGCILGATVGHDIYWLVGLPIVAAHIFANVVRDYPGAFARFHR